MTAPVLIVVGVVASACTRLNATVAGRPVSVPCIGILAVALVLALAVAVLWLLRSMARDGWPGWRPRKVTL